MIVENILLPRFLILELVLIFHLLQLKSCGGVRLNKMSLLAQHQNQSRSDQVKPSKGGGALALKTFLLAATTPILGVKGILSPPKSCHIDLEDWSDGRHHLPLLHDSSGKDVLPEARKDNKRIINVGGGGTLGLSCPGSKLRDRQGETIEGVCISGEQFDVLGEKLSLSSLSCTSSPREEEQLTQVSCGADQEGVVVNIGHPIGNSFHPQITVCHDPSTESTLYANHTLYGAVLRAKNTEIRRPIFREGKSFFQTVSAAKAYKQRSQKSMLQSLVGSEKTDQYYSNRGAKYLSRGHLAPDGDFLYREWQEATYFYSNVAPQWQSFNNGNWKAVEEAVRNYAKLRGVTLSIHTGTLDVLKLADDNRRYKEVWMAQDEKTKKKMIPAPLYYWKVVTRHDSGKSIVFVGINNIHIQRLTRNKVFCPDICTESGWDEVLQDRCSVSSGYTFCCSIQEFKKKVPWLPVHDYKEVLVRD